MVRKDRKGRAKVNTDTTKYKANTSRYRSTNTLAGRAGAASGRQCEKRDWGSVELRAEFLNLAGAIA